MRRTTLVALAFAAALVSCKEAASPPRVPVAPADVRVTLRGREFDITWRDVSSDEELFAVEVSVGSSPFLPFTHAPRNSTSVVYPDAQPETGYRFRVSACNEDGCSPAVERSMVTGLWPKPTLYGTFAETAAPNTVRVELTGDHHGYPVTINAILFSQDNSTRLTRNETLVPDPNASRAPILRSYFFGGLVNGETYFYLVELSNEFGSVTSPTRTIVVRNP